MKDIWQIYIEEKKKIIAQNLSEREFEEKVKELVTKLGL